MQQHSPWLYIKMLLLAIGVVVVIVAGLASAIYFAISDSREMPDPAASLSNAPVGSEERRDQIAAAEMYATDREDALGGSPALGQVESMRIPAASQAGPLGIPSGYPATAEGAAGQLAELLVSVLQRMEIAHGQAVQQQWFEEPHTEETWPVLLIVQQFLAAGQLTDGLPPGATLGIRPAAAQIKGSDGDWHVVCVLLDVTYTYRSQERLAYGHCERMVWVEERWVIAEGEHPVPAPSTWPGTQLAADAGWLVWEQEG